MDTEIKINVLFTEKKKNMGDKAGSNTSITIIVYCIK